MNGSFNYALERASSDASDSLQLLSNLTSKRNLGQETTQQLYRKYHVF